MSINQDFSDLFAELNAAGARYLLVGGYAIAVHAEPRFTKDLDLWIDPDGDNPSRVYEALDRFGAPMQQFALEDLRRPEMVIQLASLPTASTSSPASTVSRSKMPGRLAPRRCTAITSCP